MTTIDGRRVGDRREQPRRATDQAAQVVRVAEMNLAAAALTVAAARRRKDAAGERTALADLDRAADFYLCAEQELRGAVTS